MQIPNMQNNQAFWSSGFNRFETAIMNTPQVIGEGDVVSSLSPEGIIQYFFMPISQWLPYVPNNPTVKSSYNNFNPNITTWFVRSISNPLPPMVFNYSHQRSWAVPFPTVTACYNSDCNVSNPGFQLKLHNDSWTSTTDLYYFYPGSRQWDWMPKKNKNSAAVQVQLPALSNTSCRCEVICNKRCHCPNKHKFEHEENCMSVEDVRPKHEVKYKKSNNQSSMKCNTRKTNKAQIFCACENIPERPGTSDKLVTTFADQNTGCTSEVGRETQTIFKNSSFTNTTMTSRRGKESKRKTIQPEKWCPKTSYAKKTINSVSSKTSESCDCTSETE